METITFKAPPGTRSRLKKIGEISALMRQQVDKLLNGDAAGFVSAHDKAKHLISPGSGRTNSATSKDYLKQYAKKPY
jgi:hypothetical protein